MERIRSYERLFFDGEGLVPPPEQLRKVLVIGAGVAGLQTARQLLKLGTQVLILETNDDVGGVWIRNYVGFGLQVPWRMYQFPEFPWPKDLQPSSEYPTGQEVLEYVRAYCREYDLRRYIRFNCKLLRLRWCAASRQWDALYCDTLQEKFFKVSVDYTVICAGIYSQPYIPNYEGTDSYAGIQLHAKEFVDLSLARGRRVVIVGAGKTALDCVSSIVATNTATSVTLLYRQAHWPVPRRMLGTSIRRLMFNRAMTTMMPPYYTASRTTNVASKATAPLRRLFWRSIESLITRKFRITENMRPRVHLPADLFYGGQILDNTMDKLVRSEALVTIKGEINRFVRNGVILQDGNFVAADLVLYCTGYLKTYDYLEGDMRSRLDLQKDGLYLYRNCLPYAVPHLAFIGSEVSTYNNILTHGLQALWLAQVLSGRLQLPPPVVMAEDVRAQQRWRRSVMPAQRSRGSVLMVYMMQYHDQLLADMGQAPARKGYNLIAECFGAYTAEDYLTLMREDDTELAEHRTAEAQLAAAGVPPAVLAASLAGRSGALSSGAAAAAAVPAAAAAAHGRGGGGGGGGTGSGALLGPVMTNPLLDERFFGGSSRAGTSISARSGYGQDGGQDDSCAAATLCAAAGPEVSGQFSAEAAAAAAGARGATDELMATGGTRGPHECPSVGGGVPGRISQVEWNANLTDSQLAAAHRSGSGKGTGSVTAAACGGVSAAVSSSAATSVAATASAPAWTGSEQRPMSTDALGMRAAVDISKLSTWRGDGSGGGGGGSYSDGGRARAGSRRPATVTSGLPLFRVAGVGLGAAESTVSDSRPVPVGAAAAAAPTPQGFCVSKVLPSSCGGGAGGGGGVCMPRAVVTAPVVAQEGAGGGAAGGCGGSFSALSPPALMLASSVSGGFAAPNSPSRLSRHTGPGSPLPRGSTVHPHPQQPSPTSRGSALGAADPWDVPARQLSLTHLLKGRPSQHLQQQEKQHPHVRWSLVHREEVVDGGDGGGVGVGVGSSSSSSSIGSSSGVVQPRRGTAPQLRSPPYSIPEAPDAPVAAFAAAASAAAAAADGNSDAAAAGEDGCTRSSSLRIEGSSGDDGVASGGSSDGWCGLPADGPSPGRFSAEPHQAATGNRHVRAKALSARISPHSVARRPAGHKRSPMGQGGLPGLATDPPPAAVPAPQRGKAPGGEPDCGNDGGDAGRDHEMPGGGERVEQEEEQQASTPEGCERCRQAARSAAVTAAQSFMCGSGSRGLSKPCFPSAAVAAVAAAGALRNDPSATQSQQCNSCAALASCSDRSRALSSCSGSRSSGDSSASCGCRGRGPSETGGAATPAAPAGGAGAKTDPPRSEDDGAVVHIDSPRAPQQAAAGTPVWHGSTWDIRPPFRGALVSSGGGATATDGTYGSPGSSAVSLSLWHAYPVAAAAAASSGVGAIARLGNGYGVGLRGGAGMEPRFVAMERLAELEQVTDVGDGEMVAAAAEREGRTTTADLAAFGADGRMTRSAFPAASGAADNANASADDGGSAFNAVLTRVGSGAGRSLWRGSAAASVPVGSAAAAAAATAAAAAGGAAAMRRAGSLARSADGMSAVQGGVSACAAGWPLLVGASSNGAYSTGSSAGQVVTSISLAGGLAMVGGGSSATVAAPGVVPELFVRMPSRLSSCPTGDIMTAGMLDALNEGFAASGALLQPADSSKGAPALADTSPFRSAMDCVDS